MKLHDKEKRKAHDPGLSGKDGSTMPAHDKHNGDLIGKESPAETDKDKMLWDDVQTDALACRLSGPEFVRHKQTILSALKSKVLQRTELAHGYQYVFNGDDDTLSLLTDFVEKERTCCPFLKFQLVVGEKSGNVRLTITGRPGTKGFIISEMEF